MTSSGDATQHLLAAEIHFDKGWAQRDAEMMKMGLHDDAVMHADGFVLDEDVHGAQAVADANFHFFQHYDFEHQHLLRAANPDTRSAFGLWQDSNVRNMGAATEQPADRIACIWKLVEAEDGKVKDVWFLRQMTTAEREHRLKDPAAVKSIGLDAGGLGLEAFMDGHPQMEPSVERTTAMRDAATKYSELWQTGDCAGADAILAADYHSSDLLHGDTTHGLDAFRAMVETGHKGWAPKSHCIDVAVTPDSNKAFVHWSSTGTVEETGEEASVFGFSVLVFDKASNKIQGSAGLRQLFPGERRDMYKAGPFHKEH